MNDLETVASLLAKAGRVTVLTGAGVSAESGIPTFRGLGGLWNGRDPMSLATPQAFAANPELVWEFYNWRRELVTQAEPNPGHRALAEFSRRLTSLTLVTQNVDRLHQRAGSRDVIELHGNLFEVRCTGCSRTFDRSGETLPPLPRCHDCGQLLRPGVVWFGESLPPAMWEAAETAVRRAPLLLVIGTSAVVYPAAGLVGTAQNGGGAVIEINLEPTPISATVDIALQGKAAEILPILADLL
ncbi:NAD-dependent deacylase [Singulisphaera sp. Ch08]|uniref:NAD-dependent protein deacylase n=1 Tax=Singulisphaera sp. Ch08 TaxID=3120278 RepID=A0AAU7C7F1_9BACT